MLTKSLAYEKWLGIRKEHQPPSLYRLLAIDTFESDTDIIANAADSRMGFVRQFQVGENAKLSAEILNELARAQVTLLNPQKKAAYDAQLRASLSSTAGKELDEERESQSLKVAIPLEIAPGVKPILRARKLEPVKPAPEGGQAAPANVDLESLVSGPAATGSGKRQANAGKPANPMLAIIAAGTIGAGCLIGVLVYVYSSGRPTLPDQNANAAPPGNQAKAEAAAPSQNGHAKGSGKQVPASAEAVTAGPVEAGGKSPAVAVLPKPTPRADSVQPYDNDHLARDVKQITSLSKAVKTPDESRGVAEKAIVLADRAIVLGKADTAKEVAVLSLAAARIAESLPLARRATVLLIQLQSPLSDALREKAKKRLGQGAAESPAVASEEPVARGPSLSADDDSAKGVVASGGHNAKWGKTEAERRKIFYDLLKAVDDYGMTPEGRRAWSDIRSRNGIDVRVTLGILNEGFSTFSDWNQPDGGGRASARMNRINWVGARTRSMSEPMLKD